MQLSLRDNLPFITIQLTYLGKTIDVPDVLIDTGSASTVIAADVVANLGIVPEPMDNIQTIQGVGGIEVVYERKIDSLGISQHYVNNLVIEVSGMDYGFAINGILGMNVLLQSAAIIDLRDMKIEFSKETTI